MGWYPALFENGVIDAEIFLPHLPQDQRSGIDPYLDIPPVNGFGASDLSSPRVWMAVGIYFHAVAMGPIHWDHFWS